MKKIVMASAVMAATAMAGDFESRPEASVPTPVETRDALNKVSNLPDKENVDWQKMREERRAAREQILEKLRNKSAGEKSEMREAIAKPVALEKPIEKEVEPKDKPKDELIRENKKDEMEPQKGPFEGFPFGPGHMEPQRPFMPHPIENRPWEMPNPRDWKGPNQRK